MLHLIFYAAAAAVAALSGLASVTLLKDIQQRVARWLRQNGLKDSALMDAVVFLEKVGTAIRAKVKVTTQSQRTELLMIERTYSIDQITDPQLRAELEQHRHAQQNVMALFSAA